MTQEAIAIRLAAPADARDIALMSRDLIEDGLGWRYDAARVTRLLRQRETVALVASGPEPSRMPALLRSPGVPAHPHPLAGFAIMEFGEERSHLVLLAVRPSQRRHGVGRRLVEWLVDSARTAGIASLHLELRASNLAARAFYRAMGFRETVEVPGYYRGPGGAQEPALRMLRILRASDVTTETWTPPTFNPGDR